MYFLKRLLFTSLILHVTFYFIVTLQNNFVVFLKLLKTKSNQAKKNYALTSKENTEMIAKKRLKKTII